MVYQPQFTLLGWVSSALNKPPTSALPIQLLLVHLDDDPIVENADPMATDH